MIRGPFPRKQEGNGVGKGGFKKMGGLGFISIETGSKWCQVVSKEGRARVYFHRNRKEMVSDSFKRGVD